MMASSILRERATRVWLVLVLATLLTYGLAEGHGVSARTATTAALLIAGAKLRFVMLDFMELRSAPWAWRLAFEAWAVVSVGLVLACYWVNWG